MKIDVEIKTRITENTEVVVRGRDLDPDKEELEIEITKLFDARAIARKVGQQK